MLRGAPALQPLFRKMYTVSLTGQGYGTGADVTGSGERKALERVRDKGAKIVLDVGANIGLYCEMAKQTLGPDSQVFCFEPVRGTRELLVKKVGALKGVTVLDFGLGEAPGSIELHLDQPGATTASAFKEGLAAVGTKSNFSDTVAIHRLDETLAKLGIKHVDLLKIDVEGYEIQVLKGAGKLLEDGTIGAIQFEYGPFSIYARTYMRDFFELLAPHYDIYRVTENGLLPCGAWTPLHEIPITTNYLAEWRS
jgi:FkbM family methyltransferase